MTTEGFWADDTPGSPANLNAGILQKGSGTPASTLGVFTGLEYIDEDTGDRYIADGSAMVKLLARPAPDFQRFTSSSTWTKPSSITWVYAEVIGGGASGIMAEWVTNASG